MPPKKADKPSKKNEMKKKEKVIEVNKIKMFVSNIIFLCSQNVVWQDKTFGLKNKKGNKNQQYIAQVEKQVKSGGDPRARKVEEERAAEKKRKEDAKRLEEEKKALFRPVMTQKVANGTISPSVLYHLFNLLVFETMKVYSNGVSNFICSFNLLWIFFVL